MMTRYCRSVYNLVLVLMIFLSSILLSCSSGDDKADSGDGTVFDSLAIEYEDSITIELTGRDSVSVFQLLREEHDVEYLATALGVFVKSIDSVENGSRSFWIYTVNDSVSETASDKYITCENDRVRWHYRKIKE